VHNGKENGIYEHLFAIIFVERIKLMLEKELSFFDKNLKNWLTKYPGKFIVIKEEELIGVFDTNEQALSAAASRFGLQSYLIRRVQEQQEDLKLPALTLGLLYANPAHSTFSTRTNA
jgi:hypothetical protein